MNDDLKKLYEAVSEQFDIGTFEDFSAKMQTPEERRSFYNAVSEQNYDLGDYDTYENRLKKKDLSQESETQSEETLVGDPSSSDLEIGDLGASNLEAKTPPKEVRLKSYLNENEEDRAKRHITQYGSKLKVDPEEIYDYLTEDKGLTNNQAKGILANIMQESRFDPAAVGDNGTSHGLFQHHNDRSSAMQEYAGDNWETNWRGQIDYALSEQDMNNYLKSGDYESEQDATRAFMLGFERPFDQSEEAILGRQEHLNRFNFSSGQPVLGNPNAEDDGDIDISKLTPIDGSKDDLNQKVKELDLKLNSNEYKYHRPGTGMGDDGGVETRPVYTKDWDVKIKELEEDLKNKQNAYQNTTSAETSVLHGDPQIKNKREAAYLEAKKLLEEAKKQAEAESVTWAQKLGINPGEIENAYKNNSSKYNYVQDPVNKIPKEITEDEYMLDIYKKRLDYPHLGPEMNKRLADVWINDYQTYADGNKINMGNADFLKEQVDKGFAPIGNGQFLHLETGIVLNPTEPVKNKEGKVVVNS